MSILNRVPVKLSVIFLALLAAMAVALILMTLRTFEQRQVEIDQRLNRDLASSMAVEIEMLVADQGEAADVGEAIHYMMVLNPAVEIYLLDANGTILSFFASPGAPVQMDQLDTDPIERFVNGSDSYPIYGDDPRRPEQQRHFSASRIANGDSEAGYLYVILRGTLYDEAAMTLQRDYLWLALRNSLLIAFPMVAVIGLILFISATRRLQRLAITVRAFGTGDFDRRSTIVSKDEVGALATSFNSMADTIVQNMRDLRESDRSRRELMANISHDLRNPLATVQGYIETLSEKDGSLSQEQRNHYYDVLLGSTDVLKRLINDLFEISKLESPDLSPEMEEFSLSELVHDVVMQMAKRAEAASIDLVAEQPSDLCLIHGNVGMIERVLINLIDNGLKHTPSGGRVSVVVESPMEAPKPDVTTGHPPVTTVQVADTGSGIEADDLPLIFDRFYIGDTSRNAAQRGSGLGLAICKRIVELHGGTISANSTVGTGTTVSFTIGAIPAGTLAS